MSSITLCLNCCFVCVTRYAVPMTEVQVREHIGWVVDDSTFGARLALVRQAMGWGNVKEAAEACGLAPESWRRWERDGRKAREVVEACQKIAATTGCDLIWLLTGTPTAGAPVRAIETGRRGRVIRTSAYASGRRKLPDRPTPGRPNVTLSRPPTMNSSKRPTLTRRSSLVA